MESADEFHLDIAVLFIVWDGPVRDTQGRASGASGRNQCEPNRTTQTAPKCFPTEVDSLTCRLPFCAPQVRAILGINPFTINPEKAE